MISVGMLDFNLRLLYMLTEASTSAGWQISPSSLEEQELTSPLMASGGIMPSERTLATSLAGTPFSQMVFSRNMILASLTESMPTEAQAFSANSALPMSSFFSPPALMALARFSSIASGDV